MCIFWKIGGIGIGRLVTRSYAPFWAEVGAVFVTAFRDYLDGFFE
jgi:hypothetical protein